MKKITWLVLAMLILLPGTALAHSKVESAIPDRESVVEVSPESVQMTFNTKIEKLSTFKLFNSSDEEIKTEATKVDGAVLSANLLEALPNDEYTVKWTIIGADGHSVEGQYTFEVNAPTINQTEPENTQEPDATQEPEVTPEPTTQPSESPTVEPSATPDTNNDKDDSSNSTTYIIIAIAAVVIVVGLIVMGARRKK